MAKSKWTKKNHSRSFDSLIEKALTEIGIVIEGQAELLAPRDTGRLAGSITYATRQGQSQARAPATNRDRIRKPTSKHEVNIGTNVEYAPYIEYGTRRGKKQSYLRSALDKNRKNAVKILRDALRQEYAKRY